jgi:hypothetical protein
MATRTFDDGFYPASRARDIAVGNGASDNDVLVEINSLQLLVDTAARGEDLRVEVGISEANATGMTNAAIDGGQIYREAAFGTDDAFETMFPGQQRSVFEARMNRVIGYLTRLGYAVRREDQTAASPTTFNWVIRW